MRPLSLSAMAVLACALSSTVAVAQTRPATPRPNRAGPPARAPQDSQPGMRRAGPMGPGMRGGPAADLLRMREQLELTDEQVTRLEALRAAPRPSMNQADMLRAQADLMDATNGDINTDKARAAFDRMAKMRTDVQISQLRARQDARNVLTPSQRTKLDAFGANRRARGGAMRARGQMRGPRGPQMRGGQGMGRGGRMGPGGQFPGGFNGPRRGMQGPGGMGGPGMDGPGMGPDGAGARGMMAPRGPRGAMPPGPPNGPPSEPPGGVESTPPGSPSR